jgi:hypothetical protein
MCIKVILSSQTALSSPCSTIVNLIILIIIIDNCHRRILMHQYRNSQLFVFLFNHTVDKKMHQKLFLKLTTSHHQTYIWLARENCCVCVTQRTNLRYSTQNAVFRVGIHKDNFADFILDLRNCNSQLCFYIGFTP